ncbi:hypothetical protein ACLOJK_013062 [Asimina triloba]
MAGDTMSKKETTIVVETTTGDIPWLLLHIFLFAPLDMMFDEDGFGRFQLDSGRFAVAPVAA